MQSELCKKEKGTSIELAAHAFPKKEYTNSNTKKKGPSKCFRCEKLGHFARDCRVKVKCEKCGSDGHLATNCFRYKKKAKAKSENAKRSNVVDTVDSSLQEEEQN